MTIRAKFILKSIEQQAWNEYDSSAGKVAKKITHTYKLSAVYGGEHESDENKKFWKFTPAGEVTLTSVNLQDWQIGQEIYLDFTPCIEAPAAAAQPAGGQ